MRFASVLSHVTTVFPVSTGGEASVPWSFIQEAKLQTDYPEYVCPAAIVHGLNDDVVPAASTRSLVEKRWGWLFRCRAVVQQQWSLYIAGMCQYQTNTSALQRAPAFYRTHCHTG